MCWCRGISYMIITISGTPGSGKSTVAKILVEKLKYERIYTGGIMRDMARERGITIEELMRKARTETSIDTEVDHRVRDQARALEREGKNVLVEGRVQFYHIPESIKVYMKVEAYEGARRIYQELQSKEAQQVRNQDPVGSIEELVVKTRNREEVDSKRYLSLYNVDYRQESNYDLIIDTTKISAKQTAEKLISAIQQYSPKQ